MNGVRINHRLIRMPDGDKHMIGQIEVDGPGGTEVLSVSCVCWTCNGHIRSEAELGGFCASCGGPLCAEHARDRCQPIFAVPMCEKAVCRRCGQCPEHTPRDGIELFLQILAAGLFNSARNDSSCDDPTPPPQPSSRGGGLGPLLLIGGVAVALYLESQYGPKALPSGQSPSLPPKPEEHIS